MNRRLTAEERRLWSSVARTVRLAPGRRLEAEDKVRPPTAAGSTVAPRERAGEAARARRRVGPPEDLSGQRRIRRGQSEIDARLDLHGHTQDSAHRELVEFILRQSSAGARCLLIITGKGRLGSGVLRARLHDWISSPDLRAIVAGYARAHLRHGGEGATYVFLRAKR